MLTCVRWYPFGLLAFSDGQSLLAVEPVNTFVVDTGVLGAQCVVDHAVAPAPLLVRGLQNLAQ